MGSAVCYSELTPVPERVEDIKYELTVRRLGAWKTRYVVSITIGGIAVGMMSRNSTRPIKYVLIRSNLSTRLEDRLYHFLSLHASISAARTNAARPKISEPWRSECIIRVDHSGEPVCGTPSRGGAS